ncbi:MAG: IS4 family transposase, partial [Candidatus Sericytochromatia bacterium]
LAVGRLGGHMNRKADGSPGWLTLWRGMLELQTLVAGARQTFTAGKKRTPAAA